MKWIAWAVISSLFLTLQGCASRPKGADIKARDSLQEGQSLLFLYRKRSSVLWTHVALLSVDGKIVSRLDNAECIGIPIPPGAHVLTMSWENQLWVKNEMLKQPLRLAFSAPNAGAAYVQLQIAQSTYRREMYKNDRTMISEIEWRLVEESAEEARRGITQCRRSPPLPEKYKDAAA